MITEGRPKEKEQLSLTPEANRPTFNPNSNYAGKGKEMDLFEPVDINKIVKAVHRCCDGLSYVDSMKVASKTIGGLYHGATTKELDELSIQTAAHLISEEPEYSKLAARLLHTTIEKEVQNQNIHSFSQSIEMGYRKGLVAEKTYKFVMENSRKLNNSIIHNRSDIYEYFGLRTVYDRYLLKHPTLRNVIEIPQYFFLRVACGLSNTVNEAIEFYDLISLFDYLPSTPTLFNSGTRRPQMSSCYLLDSPKDDIQSIYKSYLQVAQLSKYSGGIGVAYHRVRSRGSLISGTNGLSNGVTSWLKTLDSSVSAVNQGGKRKGACCVYLEVWHSDIEEFLELRDNTGEEARRTHNLNLSNWIPDLFMKRVEEDGLWSLFDPKITPYLIDSFGEEFERKYHEAEFKGLYTKQLKARELYSRMMKTLAETGNGWMNFKDSCNKKSNQTGVEGNVIHSSNLCTEILEVTSAKETAVCNLGSINLSNYIDSEGLFDFEKLAVNVRKAVKYLDRVIDINFYPTHQAAESNKRWRPIGLGIMGLQDLFFKLELPFDSMESRLLSKKIQEEIYFNALSESNSLAQEYGAHETFQQTKASEGKLQFDYWGINPENHSKWDELREKVKTHGLRNSLLLAIAPTATIASIVGSYESIEPQISNLFKRETMSGEFMQINRYLVHNLKRQNIWNDRIRDQIKKSEGSIQQIEEIPEKTRTLFRTVWEIPMRSLIDMAVDRGAFLDQSQSLNLFIESPTIGKLSSMYMYAWKKGIKTTYYLRSRPATRINKATTVQKRVSTPQEMIACSLENPDSCESCQ